MRLASLRLSSFYRQLKRRDLRAMSRYAAAHKETQGPGDARPTALDVVRDEGLGGKLGGRVFLITGASSGKLVSWP